MSAKTHELLTAADGAEIRPHPFTYFDAYWFIFVESGKAGIVVTL